jgi:sulfofructose kinase
MMQPKWDVLGLGAVAVDDLLYVERYPTLDSKAPVLESRRQAGGLAATALVAVARQGSRAAYCGILGEDEPSRFTIQNLEREHVDCSAVRILPGARPIYSVVIVEQPTGRRSVLFSHAGFKEPDSDQVSEALISACKVLFVDHTVIAAALRATLIAHRLGIPVVADIEPGFDPRIPEFAAQVDHLIIGVELAGRLTGQSNPEAMVSTLAKIGRTCTVVTAGDQGCWYLEGAGSIQHFPAFPIQAVDTTGCGDVFHGAYAAALSRGETISRAIRVATAAAGLKATRPGGQPGIPDLENTLRFLQEHSPAD